MKRSKVTVVLAILLAVNMVATIFLGVKVLQAEPETSVQYVMYIGTNDKDTYTQLVPTEEAKAVIGEICLKHLENYTIQDATGAWMDEKQNPTHEATIVCIFDDADEAAIHAIADEVIVALNQNSVLIEKNRIGVEFYNGK